MKTRGVRQGLAVALLLSAVGISAAHARSHVVPAAALLQSAVAGGTQQSNAAGAEVVMKAVSYHPPELKAQPGETVEFKNEDIFAHTVTADDGSFDSGLIQPGSSWKLTMPKTTVGFHCTPHPNMRGKLVTVSGGAEASAKGLPGFNPPRRPFEFHPILVNFTAALLPLALLSDVLGRLLKRTSLHSAATWMMVYEALITPLTGAAGWWWKSQSTGALPANVIAVHAILGTSLAVVFILLAVCRWRIQKRGDVPGVLYLAVTAVVALALVYQGSLGGLMVFGK
jgi:plastocyanin/uncharacterized membrane protein